MKFKIFGTQINVTFLFLAFISFMVFIDKSGYILYMILAVTIHESAHLFTMNIVGCNPKEVWLIPTSVKIVRGVTVRDSHEIIISLSGPMINILFFFLFYIIFLLTKNDGALDFSVINLILGVFNLLPIEGLDGGVILKKSLEKIISPNKAILAVKWSTIIFSIFMIFFGIKAFGASTYNFTPIVLGIYLILSVIIKF